MIKNIIKTNDSFLSIIDQKYHNKGINIFERFEITKKLIKQLIFNNKNVTLDIHYDISDIKEVLKSLTIEKSEIIQRFFMYYGNKCLKKDLDQFYTPITIGKFINDTMIEGKDIIDPACGTGDLIVNYEGNSTLWDINKEVVELATYNFKLYEKECISDVVDSIENFNKNNNIYNYVVLNPPFGNKTVYSNKKVLNEYKIGKNKSKEELGLLFVERSINLLKENGILFAILPSGYFGNISNKFIDFRKLLVDNTRILGLIKLPQNSFSRSGTGVGTQILILQKKKVKENYNIFIEDVSEIGYILNKKNTPISYKKNIDGEYIIDENGKPIIDNMLLNTLERFKKFAFDNDIEYIKHSSLNIDYESVTLIDLGDNLIMDIKRYLDVYKNTVKSIKEEQYFKISDICCLNEKKMIKNKLNTYRYLDISEVNTPLYKGKILLGSELPNRASYGVKKYDIIVSKLKGNISFSVILEDNKNIIISNGFFVLRPKSYKETVILFGNLFKKSFKIQHSYLATGSIMEGVSTSDMMNIVINKNIDFDKYKKVIDSLEILNIELKD